MSAGQQPPPRKGNYAKVLRNLHTEQLSKVQWKNQIECELLEDMRNFIKQRSSIEKSYGEALQKIAHSYLNKKAPPIAEIDNDDSNHACTVWSVWRNLLEETEKLAKARLAAVEIFQQQIADDAKTVRQNKLQQAKKNLDLLKTVQGEVQGCVVELDKLKKAYFDDEHVSHDAREKAKEAEEKLKKKKGGIFQSVSSLQKTSAKLGSRRDLCEEKSTHARNSYLLQLASANAHQNRYFNVDLDNVIKTLDGGTYEKMAEYFSILSRTELITTSATQTSYARIRDQANTITRDHDLKCFMEAFPVLKQHVQYEFEPCDGDNIATVDTSHGAGSSLTQNGRQYASRVVQETKKIRELNRNIQSLQSLREAGHKVDPNEPNGPDIETKLEDLKNQLRRSETAKLKSEARLEYLRQGGIKVEEFLQDAEGLAISDLPRSASQLSFRESGNEESDFNDTTSDVSPNMAVQVQDSQSVADDSDDEKEQERLDAAEADVQARIAEMRATWDDPNAAWSEVETAATVHVDVDNNVNNDRRQSLVKCIALYSYAAQNPDELCMTENEELEVLLSQSEGDGWVKARNYKGEEGFVPLNYLDLPADDTVHPAEEDEPAHDHETSYPMEHEADATFGVETQISFSSVDYTYQPMVVEDITDTVVDEKPVPQNAPPAMAINVILGYCRALYDYEAVSDGELTFYEGDIIEILRREGVHGEGVDDGWWEGKLLPDGPEGVFPSLVVEECGPSGEELTPKNSPTFESESAPPPGTPPEVPMFLLPPERVIITQPTPETEFPSHDFQEDAAELTQVERVPQENSAADVPKEEQEATKVEESSNVESSSVLTAESSTVELGADDLKTDNSTSDADVTTSDSDPSPQTEIENPLSTNAPYEIILEKSTESEV